MRIISLSSIPTRFNSLSPTLNSLVQQKNVDEVRLYLPKKYRRFKDYDGGLPSVPKGVTICRPEEDLGPATKALYAASDFKGQDVQILFCDDDSIFPKNWADRLFEEQKKRGREAVATFGRPASGYLAHSSTNVRTPQAREIPIENDLLYRIRRLLTKTFGFPAPFWRPILIGGYVDIIFGVGGVVVQPGFFDDEAFKIPEEAWPVDDIWLSAQLAKNGIPIYCPRRLPLPPPSKQSAYDALLNSEFNGLTRQESNRVVASLCQEKYGIWK